MVDAYTYSFDQWLKQAGRIETIRQKIYGRELVVREGRTLPAPGDLPIGEGRRISAAVMFLDICRFSERFAESIEEQEELLRILGFFFTEVIRVIEEYGGKVEKNTGDGLMAYFPASSSEDQHESHRAVAAALTIFYGAEHFINPAIARSDYQPLDFRICIDHGVITVADVGAARRFHALVAIGATANVACKLLKIAGPNELVVGTRAVLGLPPAWVTSCCHLRPESTGFYYRHNEEPYRCFNFVSRWQSPI